MVSPVLLLVQCTREHKLIGSFRWFYHYTGAIIANKFLRDGKGKILWDGVTGQYFDDIAALIHEIQRYQQLPRVNEASFHVEHAIIWHFIASVMPDVTEYPSELADAICGWDSDVRQSNVKGRGVGKGLTHECYHGFGHAVFYVVAKRQSRKGQSSSGVEAKKIDNAASISNNTFMNTSSISTTTTVKNNGNNTPNMSSVSQIAIQESVPDDRLPLIVVSNGIISVSSKAAVEAAKATVETSSARIQFRPNIGFGLTPDSFCEVYHLCNGARRKSDKYFNDNEKKYPYSTGIRVCLEGVVHSVRLFSTDRHDKQEAIDYVNQNMQRCEAAEINSQSNNVELSSILDVETLESSGLTEAPGGNITSITDESHPVI
jgi:hypothetical protein